MSHDEAVAKAKRARCDWAAALARLRDDEGTQLREIKQILVDAMDATEMTILETYVIAAYNALDARAKECEL